LGVDADFALCRQFRAFGLMRLMRAGIRGIWNLRLLIFRLPDGCLRDLADEVGIVRVLFPFLRGRFLERSERRFGFDVGRLVSLELLFLLLFLSL